MGKGRSKQNSPHHKNDLRREKIAKASGGKKKSPLPVGFRLPNKSGSKVRQAEKYARHVARAEALKGQKAGNMTVEN